MNVEPNGHRLKHAVQNTRRVPPEWDELESIAADQLANGRAMPRAVQGLADYAIDLTDNQLEANRYYAFGQIMCGVTRKLHIPSIRQEVIETSGQSLALYRLHSQQPERVFGIKLPSKQRRILPFLLNDLQPTPLAAGFHQLVQTAKNNLPARTQLVADTLAGISWLRRESRENRNSANVRDSAVKNMSQVLDGTAAARVIAADSMSGIAIAYNSAYRAEHKIRELRNPPIRPDDLRALDLSTVMAQLASLHIVIFASSASEDGSASCVIKTHSGKLRVAPQILKVQPSLDNPVMASVRPLHTKALACPALHVTGMLPMLKDMVPDIVEAAEQRLQTGQ